MGPQNFNNFFPCYYSHSNGSSDVIKYQYHGKDTAQCFQPYDFLYIWANSFPAPCGWTFVTWSMPLILIPYESSLGVITFSRKERYKIEY